MSVVKLTFDQLVLDRQAWPRFGWDPDRVELFKALVLAGEELPPIEVVGRPDGKHVIADGVHRAIATRSAGKPDIEAVVLDPTGSEDLIGFAYRRALETATRTALPLSKEERRRAVRRLAAELPEMSHRAIAKLVGVSHDTVDRWVKEDEAAPEGERSSVAFETPEQAARRLATALGRLHEARGLLDLLKPQRMGRHLADALDDRLGDGALDRARAFAQWTAVAVEVLEARRTSGGA